MVLCSAAALLICLLAAPAPQAHPGGIDAHGCYKDSKTGQRHCHPERLTRGKLETCSLKTAPKAGDEGFFTAHSSEV